MMSRLCNDWQLMLIEQKKSYVLVLRILSRFSDMNP